MLFFVCFVLIKGTSPLKNASTLMVHLGEKKLPMNCSKIGHSYEAYTYLFRLNIRLHSSSLNKQNIFCRSFESSSYLKIGINTRFWDSLFSLFPKLVTRNLFLESWINPNFLMNTSFKKTTKEFLFAE